MSQILIDCANCGRRDLGCADCVLSLLLTPGEAEALQESKGHSARLAALFEADEVMALGNLASQDLLPPLRWVANA